MPRTPSWCLTPSLLCLLALAALTGCLSYGWKGAAADAPAPAGAPRVRVATIGVGAQHLIDIAALTDSLALELRQCGAQVFIGQEVPEGGHVVRCSARALSTSTSDNLMRAHATLECVVSNPQGRPRSLSARGSQTITWGAQTPTRLELEQASLTQALLSAQRTLACPLVDLLSTEPPPHVQAK